MQLDIFDHTRDTMLRNDVLDALQRRDAGAAHDARRQLASEFPDDDALPPLAVLLDAVTAESEPPFTDHEALAAARDVMERATAPAAVRLLGQRAAEAWLLPSWMALATRASPLAFQADRSDDHAAPLWLRGRQWVAAADAAARIESWRRIPAPLAWMAEARLRISGLDATWALLAELAWLSPRRLGPLAERVDHPSLSALRKQFEASFEGEGSLADLAWFPAWLLTERPALARYLGEAQPSMQTAPEQGMRLLLEILGLERQGRHHDMVKRRKALRDLQPSIYAAYMKTR